MRARIDKFAHRIELYGRTARHSQILCGAGVVWDITRPFYDRTLALIGKNGLQRNMNGTDLLRVHPSCRGVQEGYEPDVWSHLLNSLKSRDCVVDVGAHIGLYAIAMAKRLGPHGKVYACEPDTSNRKLLREHIRLNGLGRRIVCLPVAVGSFDGLTEFAENSNSESHIALAGERTSEVVCMRLDTLFRTTRVDILKIDVEGFEEHVLRGAAELLSDPARRPRLICLEVHPYAWNTADTAPEAVLTLLRGSRYRLCTVSGEPLERIQDYGHVFAYSA